MTRWWWREWFQDTCPFNQGGGRLGVGEDEGEAEDEPFLGAEGAWTALEDEELVVGPFNL